jgi:hypothetical protein
MQGAENREEFIGQLNRELVRVVRGVVRQSIEAVLEEEVTQVLGRKWYVRRRRSGQRQSPRAMCNGCQSRQVGDFRRNGHRRRGLETRWVHLELQVPQVECQYGHAAKEQFQTLQHRQRIWDDLAVEIRAEYGRGMSLRCIKDELDALLEGSIGLRTLNQRVLEIEKYVCRWMAEREAEGDSSRDPRGWIMGDDHDGESGETTGQARALTDSETSQTHPCVDCTRRMAGEWQANHSDLVPGQWRR